MKNAWIELDIPALRANIASLRSALGPAVRIIFVVKSNAYGHGLSTISHHAWNAGIRHFAVVHIEECILLREQLPDAGILMLGRLDGNDALLAARLKIVPVLINQSHAREVSAAVANQGVEVRCHAKIDTGMGRLGFSWEDAGRLLPEVAQLPGLRLEGLCSHLASSSAPDTAFADMQMSRFENVVQACRQAGLPPLFRHITNSGGLRRTEARLDGVRPGIQLYGYGSAPEEEDDSGSLPFAVTPVLQWKSRVLQVKRVPAGFPVSYDTTFRTSQPTLLATIDVGYADGYPRALSNRGHVLLAGQRCPIAGRVTMNFLVVDSGGESTIREGDEAVLIGKQDGATIWADEFAGLAGTIPYEILTGIRTNEVRIKEGATDDSRTGNCKRMVGEG